MGTYWKKKVYLVGCLQSRQSGKMQKLYARFLVARGMRQSWIETRGGSRLLNQCQMPENLRMKAAQPDRHYWRGI